MVSKTTSVAASETTAAPEPRCETFIPHAVTTACFWTAAGQELNARDRARPCQLEHGRSLTLSGLWL